MLVERRTVEDDPPVDRPIAAAWEVVRCRQCRRLLARNTRAALRPGEMLEIKCGSCNTMNFLVGVTDEL